MDLSFKHINVTELGHFSTAKKRENRITDTMNMQIIVQCQNMLWIVLTLTDNIRAAYLGGKLLTGMWPSYVCAREFTDSSSENYDY